MKKNEVQIGRTYIAKVADRLQTVEIVRDRGETTDYKGKWKHDGWDARNVATGRLIHVRSAQRLRGPARTAPIINTRRVRVEVPSEELVIEYDMATDMPCAACGGPNMVLGSLGNRTHMRCRYCGADSST